MSVPKRAVSTGPLIGCQVLQKPRNQFLSYSKWLDTCIDNTGEIFLTAEFNFTPTAFLTHRFPCQDVTALFWSDPSALRHETFPNNHSELSCFVGCVPTAELSLWNIFKRNLATLSYPVLTLFHRDRKMPISTPFNDRECGLKPNIPQIKY